jgi:hypothetical protein
LRKGYCCSTNQDSGQLENAASFVTASQESLLASNFRGGSAKGQYPILDRLLPANQFDAEGKLIGALWMTPGRTDAK